MDYSDSKLGKSPQSNYLRHIESKDKGQVRRAWDDDDQEMERTPYFWQCPKQLLPSRSAVRYIFLPGEHSPSNWNAVYINTAAQGLIWYLMFTSSQNGNVLRYLAPLAGVELLVSHAS